MKEQIQKNVNERAEPDAAAFNKPVTAEVGATKMDGWVAKGAARAGEDKENKTEPVAAEEDYSHVIFNNGSAGDGTATFSFGGTFDEATMTATHGEACHSLEKFQAKKAHNLTISPSMTISLTLSLLPLGQCGSGCHVHRNNPRWPTCHYRVPY